jgi:RHS repeat-associated protein
MAVPGAAIEGAGVAASWILSTSGTALDHIISLPGGVSVDIQSSGGWAWSLPDLGGNTIVTTNESGTQEGALGLYDPFGNPIGATGVIGSTSSDDAVPNDTSESGTASYGFAGSAGKVYDHPGDIAEIQMGARQYVPELGRFLQTDPEPGGNDNAYNYPNDPINSNDSTGDCRATGSITDDGGSTGPQAGRPVSVQAAAPAHHDVYTPARKAYTSRTSRSSGGDPGVTDRM